MRQVIPIIILLSFIFPLAAQAEGLIDKLTNIPEIFSSNLKYLYETAKASLLSWFTTKKDEVKVDLEKKFDEEIDRQAENLKAEAKNKLKEGTDRGRGVIGEFFEKIF